MHKVYKSGESIPGFNGIIRGGTTVVVDDPEEIRGLQAICTVDRLPGMNPLQEIHMFLNAPYIDLDRWFKQPYQTDNTAFPHWRNATSTETLDDNDTLILILSMVYDVWINQGGKESGLCLAMAIGDFTSASDPILEFDGDNTGLLFTKGSVIPTFLSAIDIVKRVSGAAKFIAKVARFAVAFFRGRGLPPSKRSDNIKEDMRKKAVSAGAKDIKRLDLLTKEEITGKKGVIVFLHGLLSTDCGTFDGLIKRWEDQEDDWVIANSFKTSRDCVHQTRTEDFLLVGWPHDTLTGIEDNGFELFRLLEDLAGVEGPPFVFVCHSRGGLVARSAAVKLFAKSQDWQTRLCGCVTFGTPHEGAALAELPNEQCLGWFVTAMTVNKTHSLASLDDVFSYQEQRKGFPGIQDLRSPEGGGDFLRTLRQSEIAQAPAGQQRILDIFALGGVSPRQGVISETLNRILGGAEHDLVVDVKSSISRYLAQRRQTGCDHFSYFSEEESKKEHFTQAVGYLKEKLGFLAAVENRCKQKSPASSGIRDEDKYVIVGPVVIPNKS